MNSETTLWEVLESLKNENITEHVIEIFGEGGEQFLKTTKLATGFQNGSAIFQKPNTTSFPYVKQAHLDIFWSTCEKRTASGNEGRGQSDGRTSAAAEESTRPQPKKAKHNSKFVVYALDHHNDCTALCKFEGQVPTTMTKFWAAVEQNKKMRIKKTSAHVSVRMEGSWSRLDEHPKLPEEFKVDANDGVMFQVSPLATPNSSPMADTDRGAERTRVEFQKLMVNLFPQNPFGLQIPSTYEDNAIRKLRTWLTADDDDTLKSDSNVLALILAMPGSGKTRSVVEAARGLSYYRCRLVGHTFSDARSIKRFLHARVLISLRLLTENDMEEEPERKLPPIPTENPTNENVVIHFDEIQLLMHTLLGDQQSLVVKLSHAIDSLVNVHPAPRTWLKFVLTGTNIFTRSTIKVWSEVKPLTVALDGAFSLDFVSDLAREHGISDLLQGSDFLDRGRHNRRFIQQFFASLWERLQAGDNPVDVRGAYAEAFVQMTEPISNQFTTVSRVACSVFAKIIEVDPSTIHDGLVVLNCSELEKQYIGGGGLNVFSMRRNEITIYYPDGVVLEVLEAFLGRTAAGQTGRTVLSFLHNHRVCGFGVKGHLFEWLIAYDISCASSEINCLMPNNAKRSQSCVGGTVRSDPQIYNEILKTGGAHLWVVYDTHNAHQDRWVDVAYPIQGHGSRPAFVLMEVKSGYKDNAQKLKKMRNEFFGKATRYARNHPDTIFAAIFVNEILEEQAYITGVPNLTSFVLAVTATNCPMISNLLNVDPTDKVNYDPCKEYQTLAGGDAGDDDKPYGGVSQPL